MTYLVAYDGSSSSEAALRRATAFAARTDDGLVTVSVLPTDDALAESYGFAADGEYDPAETAERMETAVRDVAPDADFRAERVDEYGGKGRIANRIAEVAADAGAEVVFVGSDDVGRVVRRIAAADEYGSDPGSGFDVFLVRSG